MKKVLIIVDPQNDFITGTLAVNGAKEKMLKLTEYIAMNSMDYDNIMVTLDSHPEDHCSFKENGGIWPKHCVMYNNGWAMPEYLQSVLTNASNTIVDCFCKGMDKHQEEYSILDNDEDGYDFRVYLEELDIQNGLEIHICGIAGDYCVLETLKGLNKLFDNIKVLQDYTASIDGGDKLREYIVKNPNIEIV